ncbi:MAG: hypothetical protein K0R17_2270 [Rariglobus sp.]|jgi:hypothetical protein|nr:hypothetical protein [Rariglobus sp.]
MERAEKIELSLVVLAVGGVAMWAKRLPDSLESGSLLAIAALALLGQGFVRDGWLLIRRRKAESAEHHEEARCMCLESTIGLGGVLAGVVLTAAGLPLVVPLAAWVWPVAAALVWSVGFLIKDVVIQWSPWKLRRVKDHGSIWVRWR